MTRIIGMAIEERLLAQLQIVRSRTAQNVSIVFVGNILSRFITALAALVIIRHVSQADYGSITVFQSVISIITGLLFTGLNWALIKQAAAARARGGAEEFQIVNTVFWAQTGVALILVVAGWWSAPLIAAVVLRNPGLMSVLRWGLIGALAMIYTRFAVAVLQARSRFALSMALLLGSAVTTLTGIGILIVLNRLSLGTVIPVLALSPFLGALVGLWLVGMPTHRHTIRLDVLKEFWFSGRWMIIYTLLLWAFSQMDIPVLTRYRTLEEVAIYGAAFKLYSLMLMSLNSINNVLLPKLSGEQTMKGLHLFLIRYLRLMGSAVMIIIPGAIFLSPIIVQLLFGSNYLSSVPVLQILLVSAGLSLLLSPTVNILFALNRVRLVAGCALLLLIVGILGHAFLTRTFGPVGAAWTNLFAYTTFNTSLAIFAWRSTKEHKNTDAIGASSP